MNDTGCGLAGSQLGDMKFDLGKPKIRFPALESYIFTHHRMAEANGRTVCRNWVNLWDFKSGCHIDRFGLCTSE